MVYQKIKIVGIIVASILLVVMSSQSTYAGISDMPCPEGQEYELLIRPSSGEIPVSEMKCVGDESHTHPLLRLDVIDIVLVSSILLVVIVGVVVGIRKIRQKKA